MAGADRNASDAGAGGGGEAAKRRRRRISSRCGARSSSDAKAGPRSVCRGVVRTRLSRSETRKQPRRKNTARAATETPPPRTIVPATEPQKSFPRTSRRRSPAGRSRPSAARTLRRSSGSRAGYERTQTTRGSWSRARARGRSLGCVRECIDDLSAAIEALRGGDDARRGDACPAEIVDALVARGECHASASGTTPRPPTSAGASRAPGAGSLPRACVARVGSSATPRRRRLGSAARRRSGGEGRSRWPGVRQARDGALRGQREGGENRSRRRVARVGSRRGGALLLSFRRRLRRDFETIPNRVVSKHTTYRYRVERPHFFRPPRSLSESVTSDPPARL